jgi:hypothetical protein
MADNEKADLRRPLRRRCQSLLRPLLRCNGFGLKYPPDRGLADLIIPRQLCHDLASTVRGLAQGSRPPRGEAQTF